MKTIYECSQSKGIKWLTAIFFLVIIVAILVEVYFVSKGINLTVAMIVIALLLVVSISCVLIFPMYIISDDEGIGIRTLARTIRIPMETLTILSGWTKSIHCLLTRVRSAKLHWAFRTNGECLVQAIPSVC